MILHQAEQLGRISNIRYGGMPTVICVITELNDPSHMSELTAAVSSDSDGYFFYEVDFTQVNGPPWKFIRGRRSASTAVPV